MNSLQAAIDSRLPAEFLNTMRQHWKRSSETFSLSSESMFLEVVLQDLYAMQGQKNFANKANTYKINNSWYFVSEQSDSTDNHPVPETRPVTKMI